MASEKLQQLLAESPFHRVLGIELESLDEANSVLCMRLPYRDDIARAEGSGQHHGGVIASLIDIAVLSEEGRLLAIGRGTYATAAG